MIKPFEQETIIVDCPHFNDCSAPLCPLQNIDAYIWYPDEEICHSKKFQNLPWLKRQRGVVRIKADKDKYFSVRMLQALKQVRRGIEGINPDQPLEQANKAEEKWVREHQKTRRIIANENHKVG